ncbi:MAG TPA: carboxylesterase family protein, partial [Acidimicrobiales bacterium]|nr:carboxylesterase family protein [Acidimicrobiales bacterium]
ELFLDDLGLGRTQLDRLADVPIDVLLAAQSRLSARRSPTFSGADMQAFSPTPDGISLLDAPIAAVAAGSGADVPLMIGTNEDEINLFAVWDPALATIDRETAVRRLQRMIGDDAPRVFDAYAASRPGAPASEVSMAIATDQTFRLDAIAMADAQHAAGAPTYMYLFTWQSPALDGRLGSCHALEIPFVFDNVHQPGVELITGDGDNRAPLARVMNATWTAFARTGSPDNAALPGTWPTYDPTRRPTMVFDDQVRVVDDPLASDRKVWSPV